MKSFRLALPFAAALAALSIFLWLRRTEAPSPPPPFRPPPHQHEAHEEPSHGTGTAPATTVAGAAGSLHLRMTGRGAPLAGAEVTLIREGGPAHMRFQTGPDGAFLLLEIPPGPYLLSGRHPRFLEGEVHVAVPAGGRATAALDLRPAARIFGRATDLSGSPLPGTHVQLVDVDTLMAAGSRLVAKTDEAGRYELPSVPTGEWGLRFRHERFRIRDLLGIAVRTGTEELEVNAALEVGARIAGRVLDEQGAPLAGASVTFGNEGGGSVVKSEVDGRFVVYGLTDAPAGGSASLKGYGTAYRRGVPPNTMDVEFRLTRGGTLAGRLLTEPLPEHFTVALSRFDAQLGRPLRIHQKAFSSSTSRGLFSVEDLAPGAYWVEVEASGYEAAEQPQVTIASGQTSADVTIRLNRK